MDTADILFPDASKLTPGIPLQNEVPSDKYCPAAKPLSRIPIPLPIPRIVQTDHIIPMLGGHSETGSISSSISEVLNPDVPEFVPTELTGNGNESADVNGSKEKTKDDNQSKNSIVISLNDNPVKKDNKLQTTEDSSISASLSEEQKNEKSDSSSDNAWQEVIAR